MASRITLEGRRSVWARFNNYDSVAPGGRDNMRRSARRDLAMRRVFAVFAAVVLSCSASVAGDDGDPYLWLEDVEGAKALAWAKSQNQKTTSDLEKVKSYKPI